MSIGIAKGFSLMNLSLISRLLQFYGENPKADYEEIGTVVGLNRPKIEGLNKLMGYLRLQRGRKLEELGQLIFKYDPNLKDIGTLCVFHYLLCGNRKAEVWYFASNKFIPQNMQFTKDEFNYAIERAGIGRNSLKHLGHDKSLFLSAYTTEDCHALQSLGYLKTEIGSDRFHAKMVDAVPALILGFALYDRRQQEGQVSTVSINDLLSQDGQIGRVFLLSRKHLMAKLRQIEARGVIGISQFADLDNVTFRSMYDPLSLLEKYYSEQP